MSTNRRRPSVLRYGIDAPYVPALLLLGGLVSLGLAAFTSWWLISAVAFLAQAGIYLHTTLRGKHRFWAQFLNAQTLTGREDALDLGCGRGAVLVALARRLPHGRVHGVDIWRSVDQSGNDPEATRENLRSVGVADRVELHTADLGALPFADASFDVVTSALVLHNLSEPAHRRRALDEAYRVLRPGGRLLLVDFRHVDELHDGLVALGARDVQTVRLGPGYWYGGPWAAASVVTADKAGQ